MKLKYLLPALLLATTLPIFAKSDKPAAPAWMPNSIIMFGDDYSDNGKANLPAPYWKGRASNGPVWVEVLANDLGSMNNAGASASFGSTDSTNALPLFDYAQGGAVIRKMDEAQNHTHLFDEQLTTYLAQPHQNTKEALAIFWIGANDLVASPCYEEPFLCVDPMMKDLKKNMLSVYQTGVRHFLIISVPAISQSPGLQKGNTRAERGDIAELVKYYNHNLALLAYQFGQQNKGARTMFVGSQAINENIIDAHSLNDTDACYDNESANTTPCDAPDTYFYWDMMYPTAFVQAQFADQIAQILGTRSWEM